MVIDLKKFGFRSLFISLFVIATLSLGLLGTALAEVVLHRGNSGEPETLDPAKSSGTWEAHIQRDLFEGLLAEAADGELIPGVAERWEIDEKGLVYTFKLKESARWSNGEPVTAEDFVYALRRLLDPMTASKYATIMYPVLNAEAINTGEIKELGALGVEAVEERTLKITLHSPTPYFLQQLVHHTAYPVPKSVVEKHGNGWTKPGNMVSNGAYKLAEWVPQARIKVVKNEHFHDAGNVGIDTVYFHPTEDRSTALKRFRAGELDLNDDIPADQIEWIRQNMPDSLHIAPYLGIYYYTVNTQEKPFDDVRVRRALAMSIMREILTDKITQAGEIPAYSFVPPGTGEHYEPAYADFKDSDRGQRQQEAKRLMEEAGFGPDNPLKFTLSYNTSENHKKVAIAIAAMWKQQLGAQVELFNTEVKVHYNNLKEANFEVARAGWIADYDDPQNFLFLMETNNPDLNYGKYSNPEYDKLMAEAAVTVDQKQRAGLLHRAEEIAVRDMPNIPIYYYVSKNLVKPYVQGWKENVKDVHPTRFMRIEK